MDSETPIAARRGETGGDRQTFQNVRGDDLWTLVCLGGEGGFRILRNGVPFTKWAAGDATAAVRAYKGVTRRWAVPPAQLPKVTPAGAAAEAAGRGMGPITLANPGRAMRGAIAGVDRALFVGSDGRDVLAFVRRPDGGFALLRNGAPVGIWGDADLSAGVRAYNAMIGGAPPAPASSRPHSTAVAVGPH